MARLFGTDGVRGIVNEDLDCELAYFIGKAGAHVLTREARRPVILIGRDTRISGKMLEAALVAGICSVGGDVLLIGVTPTPALAFLVRQYKADAAVMISASHNPFEYNGIKWFDANGFKLPDAVEDTIERLVREQCAGLPCPRGEKIGVSAQAEQANAEYIDKLIRSNAPDLSGMKIVLDCANGAASAIAPQALRRLGAEVTEIACDPDGCNINAQCGSTHPRLLCAKVLETGADIGIALDGDADRMLAVDNHGLLIDGDLIMGMIAKDLQTDGLLKNDTVVATVMSNEGLRISLETLGINTVVTAVGDRYVLEKMLEGGYNFGGEQSGHLILLDQGTTGDGIQSAIQLLSVLSKNRADVRALSDWIQILPQVLVNVRVDNVRKQSVMQSERLRALIDGAERGLGGRGRILVRPSGTEPLIRIMVEGESEEYIQEQSGMIAKFIRESCQ